MKWAAGDEWKLAFPPKLRQLRVWWSEVRVKNPNY